MKDEDICQGKKSKEIIKLIGNKTFYICDYWNDKTKKKGGVFTSTAGGKFCEDGVIPYLFNDLKKEEGKENIQARNAWLKKTCK